LITGADGICLGDICSHQPLPPPPPPPPPENPPPPDPDELELCGIALDTPEFMFDTNAWLIPASECEELQPPLAQAGA
jgi:hypothetical protein